MSDLVCVWTMGGVNCAGKVHTYKIMSAQIRVPMCQAHAQAHNILMTLHAQKKLSGEELVKMTNKQRIKLAKGLTILNDAEIVKEE